MNDGVEGRDAGRDARQWTVIARVLRPQGRRGELLAEILTDFPESFGRRKHVFLLSPDDDSGQKAREAILDHSWAHKGRIVLKLSGTDSIHDAEALRGVRVAVPRCERIPLADGAVYIGDLIGMVLVSARDGVAEEVGSVTDVVPSTIGPALLQVDRGGEAVLIPFVKSFLKHIDFERKQLLMELPEGLLEINAPEGRRRKGAV